MRVRLISTGGTISGGSGKSLLAKDLLALSGRYGDRLDVDVEYEDFSTIGSSSMTPDIQFSLAKRVNEIFENDINLSGIVITHGTDSLEETAFLLWLLVEDIRPVVFTAAQRAPRHIDTDGPRNLLNAIRIAVSDKAKDKGVLVCLNSEINTARYVRKTHTNAFQTFKSGQHGIIGYVHEGNVHFYNKPLNRLNISTDHIDIKVHLIKLVAGTDPEFIDAIINTNPSGLVVEAFGRGHINPPMVREKIFEARRRGIVVVVVSRCDEGIVTYFPEFREHGIISGENLNGLKARLLLCLLLPQTRDTNTIQEKIFQLSGKHMIQK